MQNNIQENDTNSITSSFVACQSLGNRFILFDWYKKPIHIVKEHLNQPGWPDQIKKLCASATENSVDGVLVLMQGENGPQSLIFNADGSDGQLCLNGARCIAQHLYQKHDFPQTFLLSMGNSNIKHTITETKLQGSLKVIQELAGGAYNGQKTLNMPLGALEGHVVNVGNPHFIVLEKQTHNWLEQNGHQIEQHEVFPHKTNVEFVWAGKKQGQTQTYTSLVYERGCGITQACSSGAAATTWLLFSLNKIKFNEKIELCMPGGTITTWITPNQTIALEV